MTFAHVGTTQSWDTGNSHSYTPNGVGHLVTLVEITKLGQTPMISGLSASNITWTRLTPDFDTSVAATATAAAIWIGKVTSTSPANTTITWSGGGSEPAHWEAEVNEFSSTVGNWALDVYGGIDANGGNHAYPSLTPAGAGELYVGMHYDDSGAVAGSTSGYTYHVTSHGNGALYNPACGSGTQTPTWAGTSVMGGIAALIKEQAASDSGTAAVTLKKMTVSGTATAPLVGTAAVTLKKMTAAGSNVSTLFRQGSVGTVSYNGPGTTTYGTSFTLSKDSALTGIWYYSAPSEAALPSAVAVYDNATGTIVPGTQNNSPSWSGALGSGWVKCPFNGSVILDTRANGYTAVILDGNGSSKGYAGTTSFPITSGVLSAPDSALGSAGHNPPFDGVHNGVLTFPVSNGSGFNWWVDVEVTTGFLGSGTAAVTLKKMTVAGSGTVTSPSVSGTAAVTLKKMNVTNIFTLFGQPSSAGAVDSFTGSLTNGVKFSVADTSRLTGLWYSSPAGCTALPTTVGLFNADTSTLIFEDTSPSWSGAAGSGQVKYAPTNPPILAAGVNYIAAAAHLTDTGDKFYAITSGFWSGGITNGPLSCPDQADYFDTSGIFAMPQTVYGNYNIWIDVEVSTADIKVSGTAAITLKKMSVAGTLSDNSITQNLFGNVNPGVSTANDASSYTLGMEFSVSSDSPLTGIRFWSAPDANGLPIGTAIFNLDTPGIVSGTQDDSPSWSGAAGSGWVKNSYDGSVILKAGTHYKVAVRKDTTSNVYSTTPNYWAGAGPGASGLSNGVVSAPNSSSTTGLIGQDSFFTGGGWTAPDTSFNDSNYWIDVEVRVAPSADSGTAAVTLKKMTVAGTATAPVSVTAAVDLKKMTVFGLGKAKISGTIDVSLRKMTDAGVGFAPIFGAVDITLPKMQVSASDGHVVQASSLFIFMQP